MTWVMLNPSTADADIDDPTIRRCIAFSQREKFDRMYVVNLFDYRATKPADLFKTPEPESIWNAPAIMNCLDHSNALICAWGAGASKIGSRMTVAIPAWARAERKPVLCLGKTKAGWPRHPLYVRSDQPLEEYP